MMSFTVMFFKKKLKENFSIRTYVSVFTGSEKVMTSGSKYRDDT